MQDISFLWCFYTVEGTSWGSNTFDPSPEEANFSQRKVSKWIRINNNCRAVRASASMSVKGPLGGKYCKNLREKLTYLYILMHFKWKIIFLRFCSVSHIILFALQYWICKWSFVSCVPHMLLVFDHLYKGHCDEEYASTLWSLVTVCLSGLLWLSNWGPFLPGRARREGDWLLEVEKEGRSGSKIYFT